MNARLTTQVVDKYSKCKKCGHDKIGGKNGGLHIFDNTLIRDCKCGHRSIVITDSEKVVFKLD